MVEQLEEERYSLKAETNDFVVPKQEDSESDFVSSDEDSIFLGDEIKGAQVKYTLIDKAKSREMQEGSKVKLQIMKVIVTDDSIISTVTLL